MLKFLHIENIAVIDKTDIDFCGGLNCLTGETGSGKSIVIDSINAILGERTSKELIRNGCDFAEVSALFCDISKKTAACLSESGYEPDSEGNLLIMRKLSASGNGSIRINGRPATAGILREISKSLVNIHGQHDNQNLLQPENHIGYVDMVAENDAEIAAYSSEFRHLNTLRKELISLETDEDEKKRKCDLLNYQINEIKSADIKSGEYEKLKKQLSLAENYENRIKALSTAYSLLNGTDDSDGAVSLIRNAEFAFNTAAGEDEQKLSQAFLDVLSGLEDIASEIRTMQSDAESGYNDPENIRARLDILRSVMLKYGGTEDAALDYLSSAEKELESINNADERIKVLSNELDRSAEKLVRLGKALTDTRVKAAAELSEKITETLKYLNMPNVGFTVQINQGKYSRNGCDVVEFMIRTNAGDGFKPLYKIASGGELSRVMLAIKNCLADKDDVDTLIFDEIDSGISGVTADKVGELLKRVSEKRQVICVTHLAQIAAYAANHLLISKSVTENKTYTKVQTLDFEERIKEIARIMSGTEITDNLYNSARELLDRSKK